MPCPVCDGGGDRYACSNPECELAMGFACEHCAGVYDWRCPECDAPLIDLENDWPSQTTEEPMMERDEVWQD